MEGSWGSWAIEVKTGPIALADLRGLLEYNRRHPGYRPLVIGDPEALAVANRAGVNGVAWQEFLVGGVEGVG